MEIATIGLDIAKNIFQVHGADAAGRGVLRRKVSRGKVLELFAGMKPCVVGMEACATSHYWGREIAKLGPREEATAMMAVPECRGTAAS